MKTYTIHYSFAGQGWVDIDANSKEEAEEIFYEDDVLGDPPNEETYQYEIEDIEIPLDNKN